MDKFGKQEKLDFERFSSFINGQGNFSNLKRTEGKYDKWDCEFTDNSTGLTWRVELKSRNFESTHRFAKEGLILEESKFLSCTSNFTEPAMYVNMMSDGVIIVYILNKDLESKTSVIKKIMNKTTLAGYGKIEKEVRLLKPELGTRYIG